MGKLVALALALSLAGCATAPIFRRIDGTTPDQQQFALDKAVCRGEEDKAYLSKTRGLFAPEELRGVFVGCMAQRGYLADQ